MKYSHICININLWNKAHNEKSADCKNGLFTFTFGILFNNVLFIRRYLKKIMHSKSVKNVYLKTVHNNCFFLAKCYLNICGMVDIFFLTFLNTFLCK